MTDNLTKAFAAAGRLAATLYDRGAAPTAIIDVLVTEHGLAAGELQFVFMAGFGLSFSDARWATDWWPDGSFDLPRERVDAELRAAIERRRAR